MKTFFLKVASSTEGMPLAFKLNLTKDLVINIIKTIELFSVMKLESPSPLTEIVIEDKGLPVLIVEGTTGERLALSAEAFLKNELQKSFVVDSPNDSFSANENFVVRNDFISNIFVINELGFFVRTCDDSSSIYFYDSEIFSLDKLKEIRISFENDQ